MCVSIVIARPGYLYGSTLVRHIHNGDSVRVGTKANLASRIVGVGTIVIDAVSIVGVTIGRKAARVGGTRRCANIHHMQSPSTIVAATQQIGVAGFFVNGNVVDISNPTVVRIGRKCCRRAEGRVD